LYKFTDSVLQVQLQYCGAAVLDSQTAKQSSCKKMWGGGLSAWFSYLPYCTFSVHFGFCLFGASAVLGPRLQGWPHHRSTFSTDLLSFVILILEDHAGLPAELGFCRQKPNSAGYVV